MRTANLSIIGAGFLLALASQPAGAENQMLEEITVRAEKEAANEETLSIREVRESPARDVGEALSQLEGLSFVRKGAIANDVVLRGLQRDNINVLVDGVRLHGACPSRMDPPSFHYDFAEIERVRVIRGPYDLSNPGGLGGTIDVETKRPGKGAGGALNATYGSWNDAAASATAWYGAERYDGLLGYAYKYSDVPESGNGKRLTEIYPATSPNRYRASAVDSKAYEINSGWLKFGVNPSEHARSEIAYSYQDADHVLYPYLKMDADYDDTHRLNWNYRVREVSPLVRELYLQGYWDRVRHLMDDRLRASSQTSPRFYSMQSDATTQVYGAKLKSTLAAGPGTLVTGVDYYNRNWEVINQRAGYFAYRPTAIVPDVSVDNEGLFAEYELPLGEKVTLKGGVRADLTQIEAGKGNTLVSAGKSRDFTTVSANLQLTYTPVKGIDLFTGLARGNRTPDPQELFLDVPVTTLSAASNYWHGNPGLRSTVNNQADLGLKYSNERLYVKGALFYSDLEDYINFAPVAGSFEKSYQNVHATIWGAELGSQIALGYDLYLRGTLSYQEGENETGNRPLAEMPPLRGSVSIRYDDGKLFVEAVENLAREQDRVDPALQETTTAGWATTDLKGGYKFGGLSLIAGVNNLLDKQYYSHLSYARDPFQSGVRVPETGRFCYVTAEYAF
ncbi:TonB-dependent receptor [Geomonas sp. Red875]|uniref:TonB-dependent receptor n=2 Tax=Geomesophilobacter sediminis TaxID=2798584 RepID=A0A8J7JFI2_9BACT|nr:TonB-dependent receptor [Geomesophilobacter sediminis]